MKKTNAIAMVVLALPFWSGCAYLQNRGADLADIVTASVETGSYGVSAQAGPIPAGFSLSEGEGCGLRFGCVGAYDYEDYTSVIGFTSREFEPDDSRGDKAYHVYCFPFLSMLTGEAVSGETDFDIPWQYLTQVEAGVGLFFGLRLGLNLGEALDFVLGWTGFDICSDDDVFVGTSQSDKLY